MSTPNKWPDFRLASTIWSMVGKDKKRDDDETRPADGEDESRQNGDTHMNGDKDGEDHVGAMTDTEGRPIDGIGGFDNYDGASAQGDGMDADFGPLEMFDSTAPEEPFSSNPTNGQTKEAAASQSKKTKGKKGKNGKQAGEGSSQPHEEGHHKRAKRKSGVDSDAVEGSQELGEEGNSKRKRRSSDSTDEKRRKKRKSRDHAPPETIDESQENGTAGFLHKEATSAAPMAVMAEADTMADPQGSPTVAHVRRRSQSREARSREPSQAREAQDESNQEVNAKRDHDAIASLDVENLAREAWNEHINNEASQAVASAQNQNADAEMPDADQQSAYPNPEETANTPKPKRQSTRKKSKPTYFDQPEEAAEALPSPSAMTPKPRRRAKASTKKRDPKPRVSQDDAEGPSVYDYDDEGEDGEGAKPKKRRNRMEGYTKGRFTDDELGRITKQVSDFAEENQLTQYDVNEMIQAPGGTSAGEGHAQLWSRLFAECPDRHRQKVINIARKKFHNFVARGTWTHEQDMELRDLINQKGTKWSLIAGLINRHPEDLRDRYRNYIICGDAQRKDAWSEEEEKYLAEFVMESITAIDDLRREHPNREMLKVPYEELIDWQNISERMNRTRSRLQCITKWKAMNMKVKAHDQLLSTQPDAQVSFHLEKARRQISDMPADERYRLVLAIRDSAAGTDAKIPWQKLLNKEYRQLWHRGTQVLLWHRLKKTVPGWERKSTRDCARELTDAYDLTNGLPDVDREDYNDVEEMQVVQTATSTTAAKKRETTKSHPHLSEDYVLNSDNEEEALVDPALEADASMQIDPALMGEEQPNGDSQELPELPTELPKKATPKRKTPTKTYGKKRGSASAKKGMLSQDPIEDSDVAATQHQGEEAAEETQQPKKKRKAAGGRKKRGAPASPVDAPAMSSDMEDMDDLPARVAA